MADTNWIRQTSEPAFADLLWSRPENKQARGKLLIIGGNLHAFSAVSQAYAASLKAGIGSVRVIVPSALEKSLGRIFPEAEFAPSTPSGSFASEALASLIDNSDWADGVLMAGDFGRNSETSILLEKFFSKYKGALAIRSDSSENIDYLVERKRTAIVADLSYIQKLAAKDSVVIRQTGGLVEVTGKLLSWHKSAVVITKFENYFVVVGEGKVSTTPSKGTLEELAAYAAVWFVQQPSRTFEAMTTAVYSYNLDL